ASARIAGSAAPLVQPDGPGHTVPGSAPSSKFANVNGPALTDVAAPTGRFAAGEESGLVSQAARSSMHPRAVTPRGTSILMSRPPSATNLSLTRITDVHIHVQPWRELKPAALAVMWRGPDVDRDHMIQVMEDPKALLEVMDRAGVWRVGLVNYPSPDVMGFTDAANEFSAKYARANPERLLPYGGVHPRFTKDPAGDVDRLVNL